MSNNLCGLDILTLLEPQQEALYQCKYETQDLFLILKKYLRNALLTNMIVAYARRLNKLRFLY